MLVRAGKTPSNIDGFCVRRDRKFVITIDHGLGVDCVINTLLHEWGHALAWNYSLDRLARMPDVNQNECELASHDEAWGCAYSWAWRAYTAIVEAAQNVIEKGF